MSALPKRRFIHCTAVLLIYATALGALAAQATPIITGSSKALQDTGNFKVKERVVYLPTAQVMWMAYAKIKTVQHAGALSRATRSSYASTEVVSPVDASKLQPVAQALYDDLSAKLKAGGWDVQNAQATNASLTGLKAHAPDAKTGLPVETWGMGKYAVITPSGMPSIDTQAPSSGMAQGRFIKDKGGLVLIPNYRFDTASFSSERSTGYTDTSASTGATAELRLGGGMSVISARGWFSSVIYEHLAAPVPVGQLQLSGSNADSKMNAGTSRWLGLADSSKSAYQFVPDGDKAYVEALRIGKELNTALVERLNAKVK
jgi:hypothetical protein